MQSQADDNRAFELAGRFLQRLRSDPQFAQTFHSDPAGAVQDEFPELRQVPKDRILQTIRGAAGAAPAGAPVAAGFLTSIASAAASAAAGAAVSALLGAVRSEPAPE